MTQRKKKGEKRITGPKALYRGKSRSPKSVILNEAGDKKLNAEKERTGLSTSDLFQYLLMEFGSQVPGKRELKKMMQNVDQLAETA